MHRPCAPSWAKQDEARLHPMRVRNVDATPGTIFFTTLDNIRKTCDNAIGGQVSPVRSTNRLMNSLLTHHPEEAAQRQA